MYLKEEEEKLKRKHGVIDRAHARSNVAQKMILIVRACMAYPLKLPKMSHNPLQKFRPYTGTGIKIRPNHNIYTEKVEIIRARRKSRIHGLHGSREFWRLP